MATNPKDIINDVLLRGTPEEKKNLFSFSFQTPRKLVCKKFKLFAMSLYPRYFKQKPAEFHSYFIEDMVESYFGENRLNAAFRGSAKTALKKLFDAFVLLNDQDGFRKYIKVLTRDGKNSRQIVTDVYNLLIDAVPIYGDPFEKEGDLKREETMSSFTTKDGRKYTAGTVGQTQRGHIQDAFRPDWIWFEDIEDSESIRSTVVTESIISKVDEAISGLSQNGNHYTTCNYISDQGVVQYLMNLPSVKSRITPILKDNNDNSSATWPAFSSAKIAAIKADARDWFGEYMCDPKRSENKFFDITRIEKDMLKCKPPERTSGDVKYWASYKPHHRYGQGSDHSEGVQLDANTLVGFDFTTGEQIYSYANNQIAPDLAAHEFARVGAEFGNCLYAPEINNKCGGIVIATLKAIGYPNLYRFVRVGTVKDKEAEKYGWETNSKTRYMMFFEFKKDYNDGLIKINDINLLKEMKAYTNSDLNQEKAGLITRHFDLLTAAVIAWQMRKKAAAAQGTALKSYSTNYDKYIDSLKV